jgi:hypothetical protein
VPISSWRQTPRDRTNSQGGSLGDGQSQALPLRARAREGASGARAAGFGSHQQVRKAAKLLGVDLSNTKDETVALCADKHEFISALRDYRKATKLASTYGAAWLENGYYSDGRIYASWRQLRAATVGLEPVS